MASLLRQIVAGPRARHPEAGLDLCYVTDRIIATSGPSGSYPKSVYRTPLEHLVKYLNKKHGEKWAIWEFRAEGTGYPDSAVFGRIWHYPWPDHHPPPFALIPNIVASMRNWLAEDEERVVVVHCKAGKGRSGTASVSYLISEEGWTKEDALQRFTERRMRPGFGAGVSIPSQLRWVDYVERWARNGKTYIERKVQITEIQVYGLRDGVKVSVEAFEEEGKVIKQIHCFTANEMEVVKGEVRDRGRITDVVAEMMGKSKGSSRSTSLSRSNSKRNTSETSSTTKSNGEAEKDTTKIATDKDGITAPPPTKENSSSSPSTPLEGSNADAIFRPSKPLIFPTSDINVDFERRSTAAFDLTMVTAVAHVWFNCFFEGSGPENNTSGANSGKPLSSGVFDLEWDKLDGIKGSQRKGIRAFDRVLITWSVVEDGDSTLITEPAPGEEVKQSSPADWHGTEGKVDEGHQKELGIRVQSPHESDTEVSSSDKHHRITLTAPSDSGGDKNVEEADEHDEGTKPMGKDGEEKIVTPDEPSDDVPEAHRHLGKENKAKTAPELSDGVAGRTEASASSLPLPVTGAASAVSDGKEKEVTSS